MHDSAPLSFDYAPGWLGGSLRMSLATVPLQPGRQATAEVQAFFENLLPEGELRDYLAAQRKASTLFSLLREVAGDTAGAFVLVPPGKTPEPPRYETTTWEALAAQLEKRSAAAIDIRGRGARISLAGAHPRAEAGALRRFRDEEAGGTHHGGGVTATWRGGRKVLDNS